MLVYSLDEIPFSCAGSFLAITSQNASGSHRLLYRTRSGRAVNRRELPFTACDFFEFALLRDGLEVPYEWTAQPHRLDLLASGEGQATLAFADRNTLLFDTRGVDLRLVPVKPFATAVTPNAQQLHLVDAAARGMHKLRALPGTRLDWSFTPPPDGMPAWMKDQPVQVEFSRSPGAAGVSGALRFTLSEGLWEESLPDLDEILAQRETEFNDWMERIPEVSPEYQPAAEMAWFLLWNVQVPAAGALSRPVMYMSKSWMNAIWAWDNCFNALAVARADPQLAWNQLLLFFDHQSPGDRRLGQPLLHHDPPSETPLP